MRGQNCQQIGKPPAGKAVRSDQKRAEKCACDALRAAGAREAVNPLGCGASHRLEERLQVRRETEENLACARCGRGLRRGKGVLCRLGTAPFRHAATVDARGRNSTAWKDASTSVKRHRRNRQGKENADDDGPCFFHCLPALPLSTARFVSQGDSHSCCSRMNQRLWLEVCKSCSTFWSIASLGAFRRQGWARPPRRAGIAGCARFSGYGKSETARERFLHLTPLPFACAFQRFDRASVIEVDDAVELVRESCVKVVTLHFCLGSIDNSNRAL